VVRNKFLSKAEIYGTFRKIFSFKGVPLMGKHDFVFFGGEYLRDYTLWNPIVKYNVIFERKSYILKYN
jgi:hypothetical protein